MMVRASLDVVAPEVTRPYNLFSISGRAPRQAQGAAG